jgi:hypothetical protein
MKKNILHKKEIIQQINNHVFQFENWLHENYSQEEIDKELYDDTGYPNWNAVEDTFEIVFKELEFKDLIEEELKAIGFLIARQWGVGNIFPFFNKEISLLGMTEKQLLILAEYALNSNEWSFKQQCAASLWKAKKSTKKAIEIALKFFQDKDDDIRRCSLRSLYKLKYSNLNNILEKSWTFNDEDERMLCLKIWKEVDKDTFKARLKEVENDEREYMKKYISELKKEK